MTGTTSVARAPASGDRRHASRARVGRIALIVLLVLGPLVGVEGAIRLLIAADRLPPARAHLRDFEIMWMNLARQSVPDVLILGDSVTQQGIDPAVLASELSSQSGRDVAAYNAASAAAGFGINLSIARQLAREGRLPDVAIVGIQPGAITSDASLREIFLPTPMGMLFTGCSRMSRYEEVLDCQLTQVSALWRWRGTPLRIVDAVRRPFPDTSRRDRLTLRTDGFRAGDASRMRRISRQVDRWLEREPDNLTLGEDAAAAYRELVRFLVEAGVHVVPVALPENPLLTAALVERYPDWDDRWRTALARLEAEGGVPIVRVDSFGSWWTDGSSRDVKHLSQEGAAALTRQVAAMSEFRQATDGLRVDAAP